MLRQRWQRLQQSWQLHFRNQNRKLSRVLTIKTGNFDDDDNDDGDDDNDDDDDDDENDLQNKMISQTQLYLCGHCDKYGEVFDNVFHDYFYEY